jgi:site-specific DNA-cytosine methylase
VQRQPCAAEPTSEVLPAAVTLNDVLKKLGPPTAPERIAGKSGHLHAERTESENMRALLDALPIGKGASYATIEPRVRKKYPITRAEGGSKTTENIAKSLMKRMDGDKPANSTTTGCTPTGYIRVVHPETNRALTPCELLSCMGFDAERLPHAKLSTGHRIAGNAFSPMVAKGIFKAFATPWRYRHTRATLRPKSK